MFDLLIIKLGPIKRFRTDYSAIYDRFRKIFLSSLNGYFNSCDDPVITSMHKRLGSLFSEIERSYHNIDNWWGEYINNIEGLENSLSNKNKQGSITESSVKKIVFDKLPELPDFKLKDSGVFATNLLVQLGSSIFINNVPESRDNFDENIFVGFKGNDLVYSSPSDAINGNNGISPYLPAYEGYKTYKVYNIITGASAEVHPGDNIEDILASVGATSTNEVSVNIINATGIPLAWQSLNSLIGNSDEIVIEEPPVKPVEVVTPEPIYQEPEPVYEPESNSKYVSFEIDTSKYDAPKAKYCRDHYGKLITYYANMYGIDPNLLIAIATQESGIERKFDDNTGSGGLFQLKYKFVVGVTYSAYNFNTGQIDSITATDETYGKLETDIQVACMILRENYDVLLNHNILASILAYNFGPYGVQNLVHDYCINNNKNYSEVLSNNYSVKWTSYIESYSDAGDKGYLSHVLQYIPPDENGVRHIEFKNHDGSITEINIIG